MKTHNYFERDGFCEITISTIYNAIRHGIINIKIEDTRRIKYNVKYDYRNKNQTPITKLPYSIENRPDDVNNCLAFAHLELDTVIRY